jgi:hypothetical protein
MAWITSEFKAMPQYIVYRRTDIPFAGSLEELYRATCLGYYISQGGKKSKAVETAASWLGMEADKIHLVAFLYANKKQKRIALEQGDITKKVETIDAQDTIDEFSSPPEVFGLLDSRVTFE